jgi:hypothetical protein
MKLKDHIKSMSSYEKAKLIVDTLRFIATAAAPFMIVFLGYFTKHYLGW